MATDKVAELRGLVGQENVAEWIANLWQNYNDQRAEKIAEWSEVDKYLTQTDTTTTSNSTLPWTHNTSMPKLTQIRDNLHANYISTLFPNDKWLTWLAHDMESATKDKAKTVLSYMENKLREGGFRGIVSDLLYDYIDKGNAFAIPSFEVRYGKGTNEQRVVNFIGPVANRIDPYDIVFNPLAATFDNSFKIVRSIKTLGELKKLSMQNPDQQFWKDVIERREYLRTATQSYSRDEWAKAEQYSVDGFGNLQEYYKSDSVEILEFFGDYHDAETGELQTNRMITVVDRSYQIRNIPCPTYDGEDMIRHVGWRKRSNNLWAMSPLDNLVGMQYMLDHYLNMGANALDLKVMAPKKIIGDVEEFVWEPNADIHMDENGDVQELAQDFREIITVAQWIEMIEMRMEEYAGAPREAMGIRTPGEKTAHEVQALENAAGRIFQEKITQFELFLEQVLNDMFHTAHMHAGFEDIVRVVDDDVGAVQFKNITKEDITANGVLRPIGARHFAQKAQELQNIIGIFASPIAQLIAPHTSGVGMAEFVADVTNLRGYEVFKKNIAISEQQELQSLSNQASEDVMMEQEVSEEELMSEAILNDNEAV